MSANSFWQLHTVPDRYVMIIVNFCQCPAFVVIAIIRLLDPTRQIKKNQEKANSDADIK